MIFAGEYEHTIDAKKRLAIPADIRGRWSSRDGSCWFALPWREGLIRLYTERVFEETVMGASPTLTPDENEAELQTTLYGLSARLEMDSVGRVRLPEEMLEIVGLGSEVVLVGSGDRLEIRDRAAWRESKKQRLAQVPDLLRRIAEQRARGGESA